MGMRCVGVLVVVVVVLAYLPSAWSCSCLLTHPQTHYCRADFVILATIKRVNTRNDFPTYKIRIRKEYKMSEKAQVALKSGRLLTAAQEAMCGVSLDPGQTYVISGRIISLQARITLCDLHMPWRDLTRRQRKGFKLMYKHGCSCKVEYCRSQHCPAKNNTCMAQQCHIEQGICLRSRSNKCMWTRNKALATCLKHW